jgi:hypothetical protein
MIKEEAYLLLLTHFDTKFGCVLLCYATSAVNVAPLAATELLDSPYCAICLSCYLLTRRIGFFSMAASVLPRSSYKRTNKQRYGIALWKSSINQFAS